MQKYKEILFTKETAEASKPVLALLKSMPDTPTAAQKLALSQALSKCTLLNLSPFIFLDYKPTALHFRHLCAALESNASMTSLYLGKFEVCEDIALVHDLCDALKNNKTLTFLSVTSCDITPAGANLIADALSENTTLKALDISYNMVDPASATALIAKPTLEALNLSFSFGIIDSLLPNCLSALFQALKNNTHIKDLELQSLNTFGLSQKELQNFKEALEGNRTLESLNLKHWRLTPKTAEVLADIIKNTQTLKKLDLGYTLTKRFGDSGSMAKTLAQALKLRTRNIETLFTLEAEQSPEHTNEASLLKRAGLKHTDAIKLRAHTLGSDIKTHLPPELAGIVADYLDLNGQYFKAGLAESKHPTYVRAAKPPIFKKVKLFSKAATTLGLAGLTLGLVFGGLSVILPAALLMLSGLSAAGWVQYTRHKFMNQRTAAKFFVEISNMAHSENSVPAPTLQNTATHSNSNQAVINNTADVTQPPFKFLRKKHT